MTVEMNDAVSVLHADFWTASEIYDALRRCSAKHFSLFVFEFGCVVLAQDLSGLGLNAQ